MTYDVENNPTRPVGLRREDISLAFGYREMNAVAGVRFVRAVSLVLYVHHACG